MDEQQVLAHAGVQRVVGELRRCGVAADVVVVTEPTPTAAAAAAYLGVDVARIANSLVFRGVGPDGQQAPVLVLASGVGRIDTKLIATQCRWELNRADADYVREMSGFAIGGVAPIGHTVSPIVLLDDYLQQFDTVWAAAGHVHTMFEIGVAELLRVTGAQVVTARP